jgi:hypothetical protein
METLSTGISLFSIFHFRAICGPHVYSCEKPVYTFMYHFIKIRLGILYDILAIPKSRIGSMTLGEWLSKL